MMIVQWKHGIRRVKGACLRAVLKGVRAVLKSVLASRVKERACEPC